MPKLSSKNKNLSFIPSLQSKDFAGFIKINAVSSGIPSGWLECNGQAVSRATYADLFAAIGTDFGVGDGSTTFNLPTISAVVANTEYIIKAYTDTLGPSVGVENLSLDATFLRSNTVRDFTIPSNYQMLATDYTVSTGDTITNNGDLLVFDSLAVNGNIDLTNGNLKIGDSVDTDTNKPDPDLVHVDIFNANTSPIAHNQPFIFTNEQRDTHNAWDGNTTFTAPFDGVYTISSNITLSDQSVTSGNFVGLDLYINGAVKARLGIFESTSTTNVFTSVGGTASKFLNKDDTVTVRTNFSGGASYTFQTGQNSYISIVKNN